MKKIIILVVFLQFQFCISQSESIVDSIKTHLTNITKTESYRNFSNVEQLNQTADYIKTHFGKSSDSVKFQEFNVEGKTYKNVICSFGTQHRKRIVIGAHYDVCGNQEGADDNASGVVGLLELSRLLKSQKLNYRIDLVAYSLEEPPFFRSVHMGSYVHALSLLDENIDVYGMVSLEMIGYFSNEDNSQVYPDNRLRQLYGDKGDFIALVSKTHKGSFASAFGKVFNNNTSIKTVIFDSSPSQEGVDFSDHLNYWEMGYSALMITDTAFLRNKNYHRVSDTMATLNIKMMAKVIDSVFKTLINM